MRQAVVSTGPARARRRQVIDFGVDESWEPAPRRRIRDSAPAPVAARARDPLSQRYDDLATSWRQAEAAPERARASRRDDDEWREYDRSQADDDFASRQYDVPAARHYDMPASRQYDVPAARHYDLPVSASTTATAQVATRRTVTIRGRGAERDLAFPAHRNGRRPATRAHERHGFKPDRAAMWAVFLGILLVLVAATSSHAAVARHHAAVARHHAAVARQDAAVARHGLSVRAHQALAAPSPRSMFARPLR